MNSRNGLIINESMLRNLILLSVGLMLFSAPETLKPVDEGSTVRFSIKNFGSNVTGSFKGLAGKIQFDADNPNASTFDVTVEVKTINTGNNLRDSDLKKEKYFNMDKFPEIRVVSTSIKKEGGKDAYLFTGTITIKGVNKEIKFPFTASTQKDGYLFKGDFPLNRRDFKVGGSSISLSDDLKVSLAVFGKKAG